uniref:Uncharacterized protein n=1 Tax=Leersia perrieri TaxID=77586 RepID=A0A0D9WTZ2_9ORYZ
MGEGLHRSPPTCSGDGSPRRAPMYAWLLTFCAAPAIRFEARNLNEKGIEEYKELMEELEEKWAKLQKEKDRVVLKVWKEKLIQRAQELKDVIFLPEEL